MADAAQTRRTVYLLLGSVAVAIAAAKVLGAENVYEPSRYKPPMLADGRTGYGSEPDRLWPAERPDPTPMFSSNDKSRWATVRSLVDHGTYVIGKRIYPDGRDPATYRDEGIITEPQYKSLDIVLKPLPEGDLSGRQERLFYSSKPPLFATLLAGEYWLLKRTLVWDIVRDRWLVIPTILLTVNVLPLAIYLFLLARLIEGMGQTDFGKLLAFTTAAVGTFLLTFTATLNNHTPAAFCTFFAVYPLLRAMQTKQDMSPWGYLLCGFFAAAATTFDLPAAALLAALGVPLLVARPRNTLLYFLPGAVVPLMALLLTNYIALGRFTPAYGEFGGPWYNYPGSHWARLGTPSARGIDFNDEPTTVYAFHLLFGHHGWFSLTPVWLLALFGLSAQALRSAVDVRKLVARPVGTGWTPELFAAMTLVVSLTVLGFYLTRVQSYNYGGFTSGPRWLFWLIPLWVLAIPSAADWLAGRLVGRLLGAGLLAGSVFSVFYPAWNPWRHPWILQLMEFTGYLRY
jgi:hypothetical protein